MNPFPRELLVLGRTRGGDVRAWRFSNGRMRPPEAAAEESSIGADASPGGARRVEAAALVLHTDEVASHEARRWQRDGVPAVAATNLLRVLAPAHTAAPDDAVALGEAYGAAVRDMTPQLDLLRMAHDALPQSEQAARTVLAHAIASATTQQLALRPAARVARDATPANALTRALAQGAGRAAGAEDDAHALLDACFDDVAEAWDGKTGFEAREGQRRMAHAVLDAFETQSALVVEAGTGTGKSLAYALPAVLHAWLHGERVVLSTHTRHLQQQLVGHDLPALWSCFALDAIPRPDGRRGLRFAKLLGRTNYVCRTALQRCVDDAFVAGGSVELARLVLALLRGGDGALDEVLPGVHGALVHAVRSRRETCVGRGCRREPACPVYRARENARGADVVVVNHALLFADARSEGNIFGEYDALVLDEAHNLERIATETLGFTVGPVQADALLASARRMDSELRGLTPGPESEAARRAFATFAAQLGEVRDGFVRLLDALDAHLPMAARVRSRQRYRDPDEVFGGVRGEVDEVREALHVAARGGVALLEACGDVALQEDGAGVVEVAELLVALRHEAETALDFVVRADDDDWVYYLDFDAPGDALREIVAAPLHVAPAIQRLLARANAHVYTSATLLVEGDSGYFRRGVGLDASVAVLQVDSPFDYVTQCRVVHTTALGDYRDAAFVTRLADLLTDLQQRVPRRTLVLLTSYAMLRALHRALQESPGADAPLLAQGISGPRERLARELAQTPGALLLGTRSFWEGVDLPHEALELLVLAKLPFVAPDEPIVEARSERMRAAGEDPFTEFVLPEAVLRFRQGFGRLIRSQRDRGAVLLLDGRLDTRPYGESFVLSLPTRVASFSTAHALVDDVAAWFEAPSPATDALGA